MAWKKFLKMAHGLLEAIGIEYEWKPPRRDTCKIFDHTDEHCPQRLKNTPTSITDDGFVEVTQKRIGKHASKLRHIDGVRLTKPKSNYFYRLVDKSTNVHGVDSISQPKETVHANTRPTANKDDVFQTDKSYWQKSKNSESIVNDSDSEEVKNVFGEDNGKPIDGLVDDARKKMEDPPKKTLRKIGIWLGRKANPPKRNVAFSPEMKVHYFDKKDIEEVKHENVYSKKS
nr:hypothetical protein [Tanacetum cinerariifolium]